MEDLIVEKKNTPYPLKRKKPENELEPIGDFYVQVHQPYAFR